MTRTHARASFARRFFRSPVGPVGVAIVGTILLLAFTSIGFGPLPGWWDKTPTAQGPVSGPTLSLVPGFLGGDGIRLGAHPFGTTDIGIDFFALTMRGVQVSVMIAVTVGIVSTVIGVVVGVVAGYARGRVESVLMRLTDVMIVIPAIVIAAVLGRTLGASGPAVLALVLGLLGWTSIARLVRGETLSIREETYISAAKVVGASPWRIIRRHVLPNAFGIIVVTATLTVSSAILLESALSFLGYGVRPPDTSLGLLINDYRTSLNVRPWLFWWPGVFIIAFTLGVNFIGDALRDALDPHQRERLTAHRRRWVSVVKRSRASDGGPSRRIARV